MSNTIPQINGEKKGRESVDDEVQNVLSDLVSLTNGQDGPSPLKKQRAINLECKASSTTSSRALIIPTAGALKDFEEQLFDEYDFGLPPHVPNNNKEGLLFGVNGEEVVESSSRPFTCEKATTMDIKHMDVKCGPDADMQIVETPVPIPIKLGWDLNVGTEFPTIIEQRIERLQQGETSFDKARKIFELKKKSIAKVEEIGDKLVDSITQFITSLENAKQRMSKNVDAAIQEFYKIEAAQKSSVEETLSYEQEYLERQRLAGTEDLVTLVGVQRTKIELLEQRIKILENSACPIENDEESDDDVREVQIQERQRIPCTFLDCRDDFASLETLRPHLKGTAHRWPGKKCPASGCNHKRHFFTQDSYGKHMIKNHPNMQVGNIFD